MPRIFIYPVPRPAVPPRSAIVVLGTALLPGGRPGPALVRRLLTALKAFRKDPSRMVFVTGGAVHTPKAEATAMRDWLVRRGVPASQIVMEDASHITLENLENVVPKLQSRDIEQVLLVTERFHIPRAHNLLVHALKGQKIWMDVRDVPAPDNLKLKERVAKLADEAQAWFRDRVNQELLHQGHEMYFVGPQSRVQWPSNAPSSQPD